MARSLAPRRRANNGAAALAALILLAAAPAAAEAPRDRFQQWIHENARDCCPHERCFPVLAAPGARRWQVMGFESDVMLGQERRWPFDRVYGCAYADAPTRIRCLFMPPPEAS